MLIDLDGLVAMIDLKNRNIEINGNYYFDLS
jgi:hypothetical protein